MKIVVLTGAGISAESGLKTFRGTGGLWEGHDVSQVATPEAWHRNKSMVLRFYNERRRQLKVVEPNAAHFALTILEKKHEVVIITQNVDNLHERAGSTHVVHLHGELTKVRSEGYPHIVYDWEEDLHEGDFCERGYQLRPHIVWFGEPVPKMEEAISFMYDAEITIIIGTSMQVYPAASLVGFVPTNTHIYYIDPNPAVSYELSQNKNVTTFALKATEGVPSLVSKLL